MRAREPPHGFQDLPLRRVVEGGGIARKLQLLEHEGVDCSEFYIPKHSTAP